jgi:hypothetical protein
MSNLADLCKPRDSAFDHSRRDVVLDLTDLLQNQINAQEFFEENSPTDGMTRLLRDETRSAYSFSGRPWVVGRTDSMIALGLLAEPVELAGS